MLVTLIFTGILGCNVIPGGCEVYYTVLKGGQPEILIAYGEGGLGNHVELEKVFNDRDILNAKVRSMEISKLSYGNITDYDLIIVEEAKQICSTQLRLFEYYVNTGGRLVWTGDAGTELCSGNVEGERYAEYDSLLLESQTDDGGLEKPIGPWARNDNGKQFRFDEILGVNYKGNYCEFGNCESDELKGWIEITNDEHKLTYGLSPTIPFKGEFAVVKLKSTSNTRMVATLDHGSNLIGEAEGKPWLEEGTKHNFGKLLPFIVSSQVGERVAYYASPLEEFVKGEEKYKAIIEQMYYGMLYN